MKNLLALILMFSICGVCLANDDLPQIYTPNNVNPYKTRNLFDFLSFNNSVQPVFDEENHKYDLMLSRIEKEWFKQDYVNMSLGERLNHLEEYVFGTSFNEEIDKRCDRLKRAFNAQKRQVRRNKTLFSGVPTSVPISVDELVRE